MPERAVLGFLLTHLFSDVSGSQCSKLQRSKLRPPNLPERVVWHLSEWLMRNAGPMRGRPMLVGTMRDGPVLERWLPKWTLRNVSERRLRAWELQRKLPQRAVHDPVSGNGRSAEPAFRTELRSSRLWSARGDFVSPHLLFGAALVSRPSGLPGRVGFASLLQKRFATAEPGQ